jgi:hypothetical protein
MVLNGQNGRFGKVTAEVTRESRVWWEFGRKGESWKGAWRRSADRGCQSCRRLLRGSSRPATVQRWSDQSGRKVHECDEEVTKRGCNWEEKSKVAGRLGIETTNERAQPQPPNTLVTPSQELSF